MEKGKRKKEKGKRKKKRPDLVWAKSLPRGPIAPNRAAQLRAGRAARNAD
jgi:hypothetical protein